MLFRNNFLLLQLLISESKDFLLSNWSRILGYICIFMVFVGGYRIYSYYNRLEFISRYEYNGDFFELYQDWSKSTYYYGLEYGERGFADNYYVIKKNDHIYFEYKHNYPFAMSYRAFFFCLIEQDSLVMLQRAKDDEYGCVLLKMPLDKDVITKKDIRIIPIYPGILKDGSTAKSRDSVHYFIDDFKKVPVEVINYENIISDY